MIPVSLYVRNFMCYRGEGQRLDFDGVHLACLSGENGSGKSALLGAMTWALWGEARQRVHDDELISLGATEMEVQYEFILGDVGYRVIRKRSRKSGGSLMLELHLRVGDDEWKPLTGHTVRDTQARINDLLKLNYDTFINSAFILQGRADEFTIKNPADRKKVLADILGLGEYDRLEDAAKEAAKDAKLQMLDLEHGIKWLDEELDKRPGLEEELATVSLALEQRQAEHAAVASEVAALAARAQDLESSSRRLGEIEERLKRRELEAYDARRRVDGNRAKKTELEAMLAHRKEIEQGYADLQAAQEDERRFNDSLALLRKHEAGKSALEGDLKAAKASLTAEKERYEREIKDLERRLDGRAEIEKQLAAVARRLDELAALKQEQEDARCRREALDAGVRQLTRERDDCREQGDALGAKLKVLKTTHAEHEGGVDCPLCGTLLSADALRRVEQSYEKDIKDKRVEYTEKERALKAANAEFIALDALIHRQASEIERLQKQEGERARLEMQLAQLDAARDGLETLQGQLAAVRERLGAEDYALDERAALKTLEAEIAAVGYSSEQHGAAAQRRRDLENAGFNERYHKLQSAGRELSAIASAIQTDERSLAAWEKEERQDREEVETLRPQVDQLADVKARLGVRQEDERRMRLDVDGLVSRKGGLLTGIERCGEYEAQKVEKKKVYNKVSHDKSLFDELTTAFGKKGIQAMIIENILPELEEEANTLLGRMTDGRMSIQFRTQKEGRSTRTVIETLELNISDEMGMRAYELYSGGEAYRVNFAVRVALSKLLARRAGAQLQMLVIDEGFGTQDGQGRDKLVGAIRSIQGDFEKILVVTHIEELKSEFPVRIDVVKGDSGSHIELN